MEYVWHGNLVDGVCFAVKLYRTAKKMTFTSSVEYTDGDVEDFDEAEYLAACHLFTMHKRSSETADLPSGEEASSASECDLSSDSDDHVPKARQRKPNKKKLLHDNVASVTNTSVAEKEMASMSASAIDEVNLKLESRLKIVKNKEVKVVILQEKYQHILEDYTRRQLLLNAPEVTIMVRPILGDLSNALNRVKVGNWVEV